MAEFPLTLEQIWALPDFSIKQYLDNKCYASKNWFNDRLLLILILSKNNLLCPTDQSIVQNAKFSDLYVANDIQKYDPNISISIT